MRILALDMGSKRIGVAISDALALTASGLRVIESRGAARDIEEISRIVEEYEVNEIVVGHPMNMDGSTGPPARKAEDFADSLRETTGLPVYLWDERLTTAAANRVLVEADMSRKKRRGVVDKVAAILILGGYLQYRGACLTDTSSDSPKQS